MESNSIYLSSENSQTIIKNNNSFVKLYSQKFLQKFMNKNLKSADNNKLDQDKNESIVEVKPRIPQKINHNKKKTSCISEISANFSFKKKNLSIQPLSETESIRTTTDFSPINNQVDLFSNDKLKFLKENEHPNNIKFESIFEKAYEDQNLNNIHNNDENIINSLKNSNFHYGKIDLRKSEPEILMTDTNPIIMVEENLNKNFQSYRRNLPDKNATNINHKLNKHNKYQNKNLFSFNYEINGINCIKKEKNLNSKIYKPKIKFFEPNNNFIITPNEYIANDNNIKNYNKMNKDKLKQQREICNLDEPNLKENFKKENNQNSIIHKDIIEKHPNEKLKNYNNIKYKFNQKIGFMDTEKSKFNISNNFFHKNNNLTKNKNYRYSKKLSTPDKVINLKFIFGSKEKLLTGKPMSNKNILQINNNLNNDHKLRENFNSLKINNISMDEYIENNNSEDKSKNKLLNYKTIIPKYHNCEILKNLKSEQLILSDINLKTVGNLQTIEFEPPPKMIKIDKLNNNNLSNFKNILKRKFSTTNKILQTISHDKHSNNLSKLYGKKSDIIANKIDNCNFNPSALKKNHSERGINCTHKNFEHINKLSLKGIRKENKTLENFNALNKANNFIKNHYELDSLSNKTNGIKKGSSSKNKLRKKSFRSIRSSKINNYFDNKKNLTLQINKQEKHGINKFCLREKEALVENSNYIYNTTLLNFTSPNENLIKLNQIHSDPHHKVHETENIFEKKSKLILDDIFYKCNSQVNSEFNLKTFVNNQNSINNINANLNSKSYEKNNEKFMKSDLFLDAQNILESLKLNQIPNNENIDFNEFLKTEFFDRPKNQKYFNFSTNNFINKITEVETKEDIKVFNNNKDTYDNSYLESNRVISFDNLQRNELKLEKIVKNKYRSLIDNFFN